MEFCLCSISLCQTPHNHDTCKMETFVCGCVSVFMMDFVNTHILGAMNNLILHYILYIQYNNNSDCIWVRCCWSFNCTNVCGGFNLQLLPQQRNGLNDWMIYHKHLIDSTAGNLIVNFPRYRTANGYRRKQRRLLFQLQSCPFLT